MRKLSKKAPTLEDPSNREPIDMRLLLNYGIADFLNKSVLNENHLPEHHCDPHVLPDYIALNNQRKDYHLTDKTAVAFYTFDIGFDKIDGLYNAIYYRNEKLLDKYKLRYSKVNFIIAPDYTIFDDVWRYENEYRLFKTRVIMLWFVLEIGAVVIPNAIYVSDEMLPLYLSGFESCTVMCFSTKGHVRKASERNRVKSVVRYAVDNLPLRTILVYSVCGKDSTSLKLFSYAEQNGVDVVIVDNSLRRRNQASLRQEANQ